MKVFCRQKILGSSCLWKGTLVINILKTCRNGVRKIMQPARIMDRPSMRMKKSGPVLDIWSQVDFLGQILSRKRELCLLATPKQVPCFTIPNEIYFSKLRILDCVTVTTTKV